uniref:Uncharacterized protein n=1 Tax=Spongospora subterranea TaxID=70186 RepID=A0A0H5RUH3_9EUKA|eukprot:CRZ12379.1 hypothetical protein [Spongospora subterranea]
MFGCDLFHRAIESDSLRSWKIVLADMGICVAYTVVHITVLYIQIVTLNVAVNSNQAELIVILTSTNISEIKGGVLKKFSIINVFQILMGDIVERFQSVIMIGIICAHQVSVMEVSDLEEFSYRILFVFVWTVCLESAVDCVKHGFINRFNGISPEIYKDYGVLLAYDQLQNQNLVSRRIGFVSLPLAAIVSL